MERMRKEEEGKIDARGDERRGRKGRKRQIPE